MAELTSSLEDWQGGGASRRRGDEFQGGANVYTLIDGLRESSPFIPKSPLPPGSGFPQWRLSLRSITTITRVFWAIAASLV